MDDEWLVHYRNVTPGVYCLDYEEVVDLLKDKPEKIRSTWKAERTRHLIQGTSLINRCERFSTGRVK